MDNKEKRSFSYEFADGDSGEVKFDTEEGAWEACKEACARYPEARFWYDGQVVQQGLLASDEQGGA